MLCPDYEVAVFVRSEAELQRGREAIKAAGVASFVVDENHASNAGQMALSTMHNAKGLEFKAVVVMACDEGVLPQQERMEMIGDDADLEMVYETERHLLYVACTRARDHLLLTGVDPVSEFLDDFQIGGVIGAAFN